MIYQVLIYKTIPDYVEKRKPFRQIHFDHIKKHIESGSIALGGALGDPADEAMIIFNGEDPSIVEKFAKTDPYVLNGMVKEWYVKTWNEVVAKLKK